MTPVGPGLSRAFPPDGPGAAKNNLALFLSTEAASYINGTVISIDGGQSNLGSLPMGSVLINKNDNEISP